MQQRTPVEANRPLAIEQIGLVSALGRGWKTNGSAMLLGYSGTYRQQARCEIDSKLRGYSRLAAYVEEALSDIACDTIKHVFLCTSEASRPGLFPDIHKANLLKALVNRPYIQERLGGITLEVIPEGRAALASALERSNTVMTQPDDKVLIVAADTYLNSQTHLQLLSPPSREGVSRKVRVLTDKNSDGFIPGEGAGALLVGRPSQKEDQLLILSTAITEEQAVIDSGLPCKAVGLTQAIRKASERAQSALANCQYRVASASGEHYFFEEAGLAQTRVLDRKIETQPLWLPASHVGEIGAVAGIAMMNMILYASLQNPSMRTDYCTHVSNDDSPRAAMFVSFERSGYAK